ARLGDNRTRARETGQRAVCRHVLASPLYPRARNARQGSAARLDPRFCQPPARHHAIAEPVLFGRIVDVLSGKTAGASAWPLLGAWAAFGLFTIGASAWVALQADRLSHRQRQAVLTSYFE